MQHSFLSTARCGLNERPATEQKDFSSKRADASRYAPGELNEARTQLASADTAVTAQQMIRAERLADQSRAAAEFASAKTAAAKAKEVNEEMKRSTTTLIEEMQRSSGDKP